MVRQQNEVIESAFTNDENRDPLISVRMVTERLEENKEAEKEGTFTFIVRLG